MSFDLVESSPACDRSVQSATTVELPSRILFVDDDPEVSLSLALRLRAFAVEPIFGLYGTQGVVQAINSKPHLIVLDYKMPQGGGDFVLSTIRGNPDTRHIPVILFSGAPNAKQMATKLGANSFLEKPVDGAALLSEISKYIELRPR